ncbi:MAG: phosphodiesterase [Traorella sp.]
MKWYVVSDIHGSSKNLKKVLEYFDQDGDYLILLGDILYHGPRNELPECYEPKEVMKMLNERKTKILAVRGNCDGEVDQMMLEFPITADYMMIPCDGYKIFITHGHLYDETLPWIEPQDVLMFGHIHIPLAEKINQRICLNPGSISIPKMDSLPSFGIFENNEFKVCDLEKKVILSYKIK